MQELKMKVPHKKLGWHTKVMKVPDEIFPIVKALHGAGVLMRDFGEGAITLDDGRVVTVAEPEIKKKKGGEDVKE